VETESNDASSPKMPRWIWRAVIIFWLGFLGTFVIRDTFHKLTSFLLLLLVSLFVALALEPAVNRLERRGWKRGSATLLMIFCVIIFALVFVGLVGTLVGRQVADVLQNSDQYVNKSVKFLNENFSTNIDPAEVNDKIADPDGPVQKFIRSQQDQVFKLSVRVLGILLQGFSMLLFTFYLVADGPKMRRAICSRLQPDRQRTVLEIWELAITKTGGYLYSRALLAAASAVFHGIAFQIIGTPAPAAMAVWVGIISQFLPVVGTYIAGILPLLLTVINSPLDAVLVFAAILVYQQVENYLIAPRVTAMTMEIHPAVSFGSALVGVAVLGPIGALLALPAAAMLQGILSSRGPRHDVVDSPLTNVVIREKKRSRRKQ
jgi:predicted PurR-regulated permease PerM